MLIMQLLQMPMAMFLIAHRLQLITKELNNIFFYIQGKKMVRKTAREKLEVDNDLPKIKKAPPHWGGGKMVIAHPTEFDALLKKVRKGRLIILDQVRDFMAGPPLRGGWSRIDCTQQDAPGRPHDLVSAG